MSLKSDTLELAALYGSIILLSLFGIVWDIWSRLLTNGVDGIFLLLICLSMVGVFTLALLATLKDARALLQPASAPAGQSAQSKPTAKPAAASAPASPANPSPSPVPKTEGE
jgi:hypothetical protein